MRRRITKTDYFSLIQFRDKVATCNNNELLDLQIAFKDTDKQSQTIKAEIDKRDELKRSKPVEFLWWLGENV